MHICISRGRFWACGGFRYVDRGLLSTKMPVNFQCWTYVAVLWISSLHAAVSMIDWWEIAVSNDICFVFQFDSSFWSLLQTMFPGQHASRLDYSYPPRTASPMESSSCPSMSVSLQGCFSGSFQYLCPIYIHWWSGPGGLFTHNSAKHCHPRHEAQWPEVFHLQCFGPGLTEKSRYQKTKCSKPKPWLFSFNIGDDTGQIWGF